MSDFSFSALPAANLTGTLPAIDGSSLTGISATVVKVSSDEVTAASSGSGAFQNMGLAASITPAATANKILLIATGTCASNNNTIAFRFTENDFGDKETSFVWGFGYKVYKGTSLEIKSTRGITNISQVEGEIWKSKSYDITINFNINEILWKKELIK